jgi:ATP-dependent protease ClpP protease subunit
MDHDPYTDKYVGPVGPLVLSGEIAPGDYDRLLSKILEDQDRFLAQNKIILASDGGDVAEALKIAGLVKALVAGIIVGPLTGRCVSACFFIYAAAGQREADGDRLIGINRPYLVDSESFPGTAPDVATVESKALTQVRVFLRENAVPDYLVDEMFRRASDDAYWLSADDEKNLGYRSQWFIQFLTAKCAWDDKIEREAYAGKRSIDDLKQMLKCRERVTQDAAHQALLSALSQKPPRDTGAKPPKSLK